MDWIFDANFLADTPSRIDGIAVELEKGYRSKTAWFIEEFGNLGIKEYTKLESGGSKEFSLPRLVVSTAQVLAHRFYTYQSFKQHDRYIISVASLFLSAKVEEFSMKHLLPTIVKSYVFYRKKMNPTFTADFREVEKKILIAERILLQTLCFNVQVIHPYSDTMKKIKSLKSYIPEEARKDLHQVVVNMINDSYRTTLCLQYPPALIGIAAIFLATLYMSLQPVNARTKETTFYDLLEADIDEDSLKNICEQMLDAYADATAMTSRVVDPRKIAYARSKLIELTQNSDTLMSSDHLGSVNTSPSLPQTSPTTITYPPSVGHNIFDSTASAYHDAVKGPPAQAPVSSSLAANRNQQATANQSILARWTSSNQQQPSTSKLRSPSPLSAANDLPNLFVSDENVDEVNLDEPYPYSDAEHTPDPPKSLDRDLKQSDLKRKHDVLSDQMIHPHKQMRSQQSSVSQVTLTDTDIPPPPSDTPPSAVV